MDVSNQVWEDRARVRQRQIELGKNRPEYVNLVKEAKRRDQLAEQSLFDLPQTPDPHAKISKRAFDRQLSQWRRHLHDFDAAPQSHKKMEPLDIFTESLESLCTTTAPQTPSGPSSPRTFSVVVRLANHLPQAPRAFSQAYLPHAESQRAPPAKLTPMNILQVPTPMQKPVNGVHVSNKFYLSSAMPMSVAVEKLASNYSAWHDSTANS